MKIETVKKVWESDFSDMVSEVYGRPYRLQQQGECYGQDSIIEVTVPCDDPYTDDEDTSFEQWVNKDVNEPIRNPRYDMYEQLRKDRPGEGFENLNNEEFSGKGTTDHTLYWEREFYPPLQDVVNDLHKRGKLEAGHYVIHVWW